MLLAPSPSLLVNMRPAFTKYDLRDAGLLKAVFKAQSCLADPFRGVSATNFTHPCCVHNSPAVVLPKVLSAFSDFISSVISVRAQKQMIGADAWRVVTSVQDRHSTWSKVNDPRVTVGAAGFPKLSVPITVSAAAPCPTPGAVDRDLRPELAQASTCIRTKQTRVIAAPRTKRRLTLFTEPCYFESTQGVNLRYRFANWSGSFAVQPAFGPFVF